MFRVVRGGGLFNALYRHAPLRKQNAAGLVSDHKTTAEVGVELLWLVLTSSNQVYGAHNVQDFGSRWFSSRKSCKYLVMAGCRPGLRHFQAAVLDGHLDMIDICVQKGLAVNERSRLVETPDFNHFQIERNDGDFTPLEHVAMHGFKEFHAIRGSRRMVFYGAIIENCSETFREKFFDVLKACDDDLNVHKQPFKHALRSTRARGVVSDRAIVTGVEEKGERDLLDQFMAIEMVILGGRLGR
ncbi:hypothetical protein TruAng_002867 [Truncatella angustata]|nr:hypothetical protein TruAng_002867 [Truncatella angustata]